MSRSYLSGFTIPDPRDSYLDRAPRELCTHCSRELTDQECDRGHVCETCADNLKDQPQEENEE